MRRTVWIGIVVAAVALGAGARAEEPKPRSHTSEALGFTATFPLPVKESVNESGGGTAAAVDPKGLMYMVGVIPPRAEVAGLSAKEQIDAGIEGALARVKGKIVTQRDIKLGKHPGRAVEIEVNDGHASMRAYLVDKKAYLLVMVQKNGTTAPMTAEDFFASFRLAKK
jgi:hypothetical protein